MALATYADLQDAIAGYLARNDLTARIPDFIALTEAKLNRSLFVPQMEQRSTATVDTNSDEPEFISLPSDFQSMRSVRLNGVSGKPRLEYLSKTQLDDYRYSIENPTGQPLYFAIVGSEMELAPTPNDAYTIEMMYRKLIPALSNTTSSNWLLTFAPDLYLYGSLMEAEPYMKNDERVQLWASAFSTVLDGLNLFGARQAVDAGPSTISLPGVTP